MAGSNLAGFEIDFSNDFWPGAILLGWSRVAKKMLDKVIHNRDGWRRDEDDVSDTVVETCGRRSCTQCRKGGRTVLPLSGINRSDPFAHGSFSHKTWKSIPRDATRAVRGMAG